MQSSSSVTVHRIQLLEWTKVPLCKRRKAVEGRHSELQCNLYKVLSILLLVVSISLVSTPPKVFLHRFFVLFSRPFSFPLFFPILSNVENRPCIGSTVDIERQRRDTRDKNHGTFTRTVKSFQTSFYPWSLTRKTVGSLARLPRTSEFLIGLVFFRLLWKVATDRRMRLHWSILSFRRPPFPDIGGYLRQC